MSLKDIKTAELIRQLAAEFLHRESNGTSLITVTRVEMYNKLSKAVVLFTVFPDAKQDEALDFAMRNRLDFKEFLKKRTKLMRLPRIEFAIDFAKRSPAPHEISCLIGHVEKW